MAETDFTVLMKDMADYLLAHPESSVEGTHDQFRSRSFISRLHIIETFKLKVQKREFPGLYLRNEIVLRDIREVK